LKAANELTEEGLDPASAIFERELDLRYTGQGYELRVPLRGLWSNALDGKTLAAARERFDGVHARIHGHAAKEKGVEVVSYRLRVRVNVPKYTPHTRPPAHCRLRLPLQARARAILPRSRRGQSGSSGALMILWKDDGRSGQPSMQYEILGSAYGGGKGNDGASALATHLSNLHITPIEILESEFPCRIFAFDLVTDSGAGEFRGGLAFRRFYELLQDATVVRRYDRAKFPPNGIGGGKPGSRSRFVIYLGMDEEQETPASGRYELHAGERFFLQSAGGGALAIRKNATARHSGATFLKAMFHPLLPNATMAARIDADGSHHDWGCA
jgi:hypothetical protein